MKPTKIFCMCIYYYYIELYISEINASLFIWHDYKYNIININLCVFYSFMEMVLQCNNQTPFLVSVCLSIYLYIYLSIYLSLYPSICLSIYIYIYILICLPILDYLSTYLTTPGAYDPLTKVWCEGVKSICWYYIDPCNRQLYTFKRS